VTSAPFHTGADGVSSTNSGSIVAPSDGFWLHGNDIGTLDERLVNFLFDNEVASRHGQK
jgi:hypothetical protein